MKPVLTAQTIQVGGFYNWCYQPERLVYVGRTGNWHQFEKIDNPGSIWCEVLSSDLHMLEETAQPNKE